MVQNSLQSLNLLSRRFLGLDYRCAATVLSTPAMLIVVDTDLMPEDVP